MALPRTSANEVYTQLIRYDAKSQVVPRPKEMEVLVLGMSRTGTMSMYVALRKLGLNAYHFLESSLQKANNHHQLWTEALQAKYYGKGRPLEGADFDKILWEYEAVTDAPCCMFVDELLAAYPNAKVILTIRETDAWLNSMDHSFLEILSWRSLRLLELLDWDLSHIYWPLLRMIATVWGKGDCFNHEALRETFDAHNAHVRAVVPRDRLLEFRPGDGWDPLCRFLNKEVPQDTPFPHANEGNLVAIIHHSVYWRQWNYVRNLSLGWVTAAIGGIGFAWWYRTSYAR